MVSGLGRVCALTVWVAGALSLRAQAPTALTVVSATKSQVQLKWTPGDTTATSYVVERKPLNGTYSTALNATGATASDTNIDAYTTYVYRVRSTAPAGQSGPSNEVTVGPPPYGFNLAAAPPASVTRFDQFGVGLRMALDSSGDPALAYIFHDPNEDDDFSDSALYFVKWNRAAYQWTTPLKIALTDEVDYGSTHALSIARDSSNGMWGIAFENHTNPDFARIDLALSTDNGATWKTQTIATDVGGQAFEYQSPSIAMNGGNVYLVFYHAYEGLRYVTGKETDDPKTWKAQVVPPLAGYEEMGRVTALALDSAGVPGVAFSASGDNGPAEGFWRPGNGSSVLAIDNGGHGTDDPDVKLTFFGTQPRLIFAGADDDNYFADYSHTIWVTTSPDGGASWTKAVNVPSDGNRSMDPPISIAAGSQGQTVFVAYNNGGNQDGVTCGQPKLSRSTDLVSWTTCGLATLGTPNFTATYPVVLFGDNDKLWVSFQQTDNYDELPVGITVWREPPDWLFPPR